ncbi:hypothetical protein [Ligilactobacillus equi]|uniref:Phage protein n=1 Tax=Ligilactobacillus equi DPC 6820 TaxID=1392007 RepID=V7HXW6_9LACO|nr:hypothetical protein [Ligilactobacillus equi]ETA74058.1 phage protein [Ligilactobacillus equi DPC 6820]
MKYREFEETVKAIGLVAKNNPLSFCVYNPKSKDYENCIVVISKEEYAKFSTKTPVGLDRITIKTLLIATVALASTPLEERGEEKKYNVVACREKYGTKGAIKERKTFYYRNEDGYLNTAVSDFNAGPDQQWTLEQIKDWGLESCERIEVR